MIRAVAYVTVIGLLGGAAALYHQAPAIAAGALLYPSRNAHLPKTPSACVARDFEGAGVVLRGWQCAAVEHSRGTIVYLHGVADNRSSAVGPIARFTQQGYTVVAYDSRAHGQSEGRACTYGYFEKQDLSRVIDTFASSPVVVVGTSLGAAVALQAAADDERIRGVVAAEVFSDLDTIARERAPFFLWDEQILDAFDLAEKWAGFDIESASPRDAAHRIHVPVLVLHGDADTETLPSHSRRVYESLAGPKRLILVPGARHNQTLGNAAAWTEIDRWIAAIMRGV